MMKVLLQIRIDARVSMAKANCVNADIDDEVLHTVIKETYESQETIMRLCEELT